jgi:phage gp29-like protein
MAKRKKIPAAPSRQALDGAQSAELGWLQHQFAEHPARGLTPARLHQLLTNAEQGDLMAQADLFCDMEERDGHLFSDMSKRKRAVTGLTWGVKPCRNASPADKKLAEEVLEWLEDIDGLEQVFFDALDAIGHGYSVQEITWGRAGALWIPESLEYQPPRKFQTPHLAPNELRWRDGSVDGAEVWPFGCLVHQHSAKSGYIARSGLHRVLSWPFLFKHYGVRDLMEFLEIYGLPMRLGKYPTGATPEEKGTLLRAVMSIGHNAAGIIPQGMSIDFEEAAKGTSDPHMALIEWCEKTQSKAILGGTLTSSEGSHGTQALGNVHNEVRRELTESDALQLARTLTQQLIVPMLQLNKPNIDPAQYPKFYFDLSEPEDIQTYSEALPKLVEIGMQIPQQWAHEKLGIPMPDSKDVAVLAKPQSKPLAIAANSQINTLKLAALSQQIASPYPDQATLDNALDGLDSNDLNTLTEAIIKPILAAMSQANSPTEALGILANLHPASSVDQLQQRMERLLFSAEIFGAINVRTELV